MLKTKRALSIAVVGAILSPMVHSQMLEEVVVTATKRNASLQEVPIAVTAIGEETLKTGNFSSLVNIVNHVPSVSMGNAQAASNTANVRVRGIGTVGNNAGFESSVGIFVDGVYQARPGVALGEMVDMAQVEVLRGPQGTLFGRNTSVGAISIKSNAPVIGESEGFVSASIGDHSLKNVKGAYNIAAGENLAFRLAGSYRERDGVIEAATPGVKDMHDKDRYLLRAQALWEATDTLSIRFNSDLAGNDEICCVSVGVVPNSDGTLPPGLTLADADEFTSDSSERFDKSDQWGVSAELTWELDSGTFTWIPAYRTFDAEYSGDNDWTAINQLFIKPEFPNETEIDSMTQELRFQSTAMNDRLDWLVGFYYSEEDITEISRLHTGPDQPLTSPFTVINTPVGPVPVPAGPSGEYHADNLFEQSGESFAIFTHNIFSVTDDLTLTVGLRYTEEDKEGGLISSGGFNPDCLSNGPFPGAGCLSIVTPAANSPLYDLYDEKFEDDALTYTVNLHYTINDDISFYGAVSTGFKSGGINLDVTGSGGSFESENITSYELGMKSTWLDGRVTANAALFYMDLEDFQLASLDSSVIQFRVFNVAEAESTGFELDTNALLADNFNLTFNFAWTDATFPADCSGGLTDPTVLFMCGRSLPNAPEYVLTTGFRWDIPLGSELLATVSPNVRWEDESEASVGQELIQDSTTIVDLSIQLTNQSNTWSVEAWGRNLTNEVYLARAYNTLSNVAPLGQDSMSSYINEPRTYGITARFNF